MDVLHLILALYVVVLLLKKENKETLVITVYVVQGMDYKISLEKSTVNVLILF